MENKEVQKYVIYGLFIGLLWICFLIIKPFVNALLASFLLAFIFHPFYKKINKFIKKDYIAALLTVFLILILIIGPLVLTGVMVFREANTIAYKLDIEKAINSLTSYTNNPKFGEYIADGVLKSVDIITIGIEDTIRKLPSMIINFIIAILTTFYLLMYGNEFVEQIKRVIPFKHKNELVEHLKVTSSAILRGYFLIAVIEFLIAAIAFTIIGLKPAFLLALLIAIAVLIPFIGPFIIVAPFFIIALIEHNYTLLIELGLVYLILTYLDNVTRPKLIGQHAKIHPVIVLMGVIGGVSLFGFVGLIAGPLILSSMLIIIQNYYYEYVKE
jgi:predicted PurR-regulated permease PerM